jgi:TatD DNase family protein
MIDVHCHLNFKSFVKDYDEVIARALKEGVKTIINVGTKIDSSKWAVDLAQKYENLYAIVGVHPHHADKIELEANWLNELENLTKHPKVVAIGEIGMDYFRYLSNGIVEPTVQKEVFIKQIELAHKTKLPLQIHNRHAGKDIIDILKAHKNLLMNPPGMFHCFAGSMDILKSALNLGFSIGFDGNITYPGLAPGEDTSLSDIARYTPIDRIVTETDSPFLTPVPHRGSRNEPSYVIIVGEFIAQLKGVSFEALRDQTVKNAETLFKLNAKR